MSSLWTAEKLVNQVFPRAFLVDPIIPRGGVVFFHGKRGIGKSQLALTLATALVEKGQLFGRYPTYLYGPIVYVQADMTAMITQRRIRAMRRYYELKDLYFFFPTFFDLATIDTASEIVKEIQALHPALIIWDTLRKIQRLGSNEDDVPSFIYGKSQSLFPSATHFFVHHDKKTVVDQEDLDEEELFRGSGAWLDDCDTGLHLAETAPSHLRLTFTKHRTCEDQAPLHLRLNPDNLLLYSTGDQLMVLRDKWVHDHPQGTQNDLRRFLLGSFVAPPQVIDKLVETA